MTMILFEFSGNRIHQPFLLFFMGIMIILSSSCSSEKKVSMAYMDDIYHSPEVKYQIKKSHTIDYGALATQDASVIRPQQEKSLNQYPVVQGQNRVFNPVFTYGMSFRHNPFYFAAMDPRLNMGMYMYDPFFYPDFYSAGMYGWGYPGFYSSGMFGWGYSGFYTCPSFYPNTWFFPPENNASPQFSPPSITDPNTSVNYRRMYTDYATTPESARAVTRSRSQSKSTYSDGSSYQKRTTRDTQNQNYINPGSSRTGGAVRSTGSSGGSYSGKRIR
jgi:hypothetical protein